MGKRKKQPQQQQTLFDLTPYTHQPGYWEMEDEDVFSDDYMNRAMLYLESKPKSSPVERESVERENFLDNGLAVGDTTITADKSSPVERESVERENFLDDRLAIGDTFTFNTDRCDRHVQIANRPWNNKQATIVDLNPPNHPGKIGIGIGKIKMWLEAKDLPLYGYQKSSPVPREIVQRENFQWVEQYKVKRRYLYWRYCYLSSIDAIEQVVKLHIPGPATSIREGRAELVRESIAKRCDPVEIEGIINSWKT